MNQKVQTFVMTWGSVPIKFRWAQIVFWNRNELKELQWREMSRMKQSGLSGGAIQDMIYIERISEDNALYPFWPKDVYESDQMQRMKMFYKSIYPIWAPIVSEHIKKELEDTGRDKAKDFDDLKVLHLCDINIYDSGNKPDRITSSKHGNEERKQAVVGLAKQAYSD